MTVLDDTLLGDARALAALGHPGGAAVGGHRGRPGPLHGARRAGGARRRSAGPPPPRAGAGAPAGVVDCPRSHDARRPPGARRARCRSCCRRPCRAGSARWTSWSRTPPTPPTRELADSVGRAVSRGAEVVLSAPGDGPVASAGAGRVRLVEPRIPVPPGLDLPRALAVGLTVVAALDLLPDAAAPRPRRARRHSRRRGRAQRPRQRRVHQPGEVARAAAGRAHAAAVGHRPARRGRRRARGRRVGDARRGRGARGRHRRRPPPPPRSPRRLEAAATRDIFHDPFDDAARHRAAAAAARADRHGRGGPGARHATADGRDRSAADLLHPVDEVPRGTAHAALLRAGLLATRFDLAAVYLGLATRTIAPA